MFGVPVLCEKPEKANAAGGGICFENLIDFFRLP